MSDNELAADQPGKKAKSDPVDASSVLAAAVTKERARENADTELIKSLEATILRVDAVDGAWEKAAADIKKIALSRAESRMENS